MDLVGDAAGIGGDGGVDLGAVNTLKDFHIAPEADIFGIADIAPDSESILLMIEGVAAASDRVLGRHNIEFNAIEDGIPGVGHFAEFAFKILGSGGHEDFAIRMQTFETVTEIAVNAVEGLFGVNISFAAIGGFGGEINTFELTAVKFKEFILNGNEHALTNGSFVPLEESSDRVLRKNAFEAFYGRYGDFKNTIAMTLDGEFKKRNFFAKARKYNTTREAALDHTEVPEEVYDNLIDLRLTRCRRFPPRRYRS